MMAVITIWEWFNGHEIYKVSWLVFYDIENFGRIDLAGSHIGIYVCENKVWINLILLRQICT